jgi:hypothetical protein
VQEHLRLEGVDMSLSGIRKGFKKKGLWCQKENQDKLFCQQGQQGRTICMSQKIQKLYIDRLVSMGLFWWDQS